MIRAGDTVLHHPSGERWIVACVRAERGELSWCGWPEGIARLGDCELLKSCTDEQHVQMLRDWASKGGNDHRVSECARQLAALEAYK